MPVEVRRAVFLCQKVCNYRREPYPVQRRQEQNGCTIWKLGTAWKDKRIARGLKQLNCARLHVTWPIAVRPVSCDALSIHLPMHASRTDIVSQPNIRHSALVTFYLPWIDVCFVYRSFEQCCINFYTVMIQSNTMCLGFRLVLLAVYLDGRLCFT